MLLYTHHIICKAKDFYAPDKPSSYKISAYYTLFYYFSASKKILWQKY